MYSCHRYLICTELTNSQTDAISSHIFQLLNSNSIAHFLCLHSPLYSRSGTTLCHGPSPLHLALNSLTDIDILRQSRIVLLAKKYFVAQSKYSRSPTYQENSTGQLIPTAVATPGNYYPYRNWWLLTVFRYHQGSEMTKHPPRVTAPATLCVSQVEWLVNACLLMCKR